MEETFYNILTYLIVFIALFLAGRKTITKMFSKKESPCNSGCGGCTSTCELKKSTIGSHRS